MFAYSLHKHLYVKHMYFSYVKHIYILHTFYIYNYIYIYILHIRFHVILYVIVTCYVCNHMCNRTRCYTYDYIYMPRLCRRYVDLFGVHPRVMRNNICCNYKNEMMPHASVAVIVLSELSWVNRAPHTTIVCNIDRYHMQLYIYVIHM